MEEAMTCLNGVVTTHDPPSDLLPQNHTSSVTTTTKRSLKATTNTGANDRTRYRDVLRPPWGRYVVEIRDPLSKELWWLDTFDTAEEAARAYDFAACAMCDLKARANFVYPPPTPAPVDHHPLSMFRAISGWSCNYKVASG